MNIPPILRLVIGESDAERAAKENMRESGLLMDVISSLKGIDEATDGGTKAMENLAAITRKAPGDAD